LLKKMPNPYLQVESGAESKRYELEIGIDDVTIGRSTECQWVISSGAVSRRHARIKRRSAEITVEDLGSSNGTFVNGERLSGPKTLHDQDAVKFGSVEAHFFVPPQTSESDATIAIGGDVQGTMLAKPATPATVVLPPPAEPAPEPPKASPTPAAEPSRAASAPEIPAAGGPTGTGTHTVVQTPTAAPSESPTPSGATIAVPPPAATVAVPPPGGTVAVPPPTTSAAESIAPSETSVRPAPSLPSTPQTIGAAAHPTEASLVELAVIAGASFLVVFGIGAMLIRFAF
jgi:predicted component of type VI protein secretion system